jgi:uncharacterized protein YigA (DUF484 family)
MGAAKSKRGNAPRPKMVALPSQHTDRYELKERENVRLAIAYNKMTGAIAAANASASIAEQAQNEYHTMLQTVLDNHNIDGSLEELSPTLKVDFIKRELQITLERTPEPEIQAVPELEDSEDELKVDAKAE